MSVRSILTAKLEAASFFWRNNHATSVLKNKFGPTHAAESPGHVADDAQSRHRQHPERAHGGVLRAAGDSRPDHHRRHVAVTQRAGLRAHTGSVFSGAGGGVAAHYR